MNRYTNESLRTPHRNFSLFTRLFVSFTVLIAFQCAYAQQADQEVLDNAAVVKLVQAHLGTDLIIEQIRNSPSNFTLTTASLIKLKQQGVPDKVIAAMQAAKGASAKSPAGAGSAGAASVSTRMVETNRPDQIGSVPSWQLKTVKDAMTDKVSSELELQAVGDPVGRLRATASCKTANSGTFELRGVGLALQVLTRGLEFERSPNPSAQSRCAHFDVRLSVEETVHNTQPGSCEKDAVNFFIEEDLNKVTRDSKDGTPASYLLGLKFRDPYERNVIPANDLFFKSDFMRINLHFANGQSTIVTLPLNDPEFKKFVDKCMPAPEPSNELASNPPLALRLPHSLDGFVYNSPATSAQRTYKGTVDGFAAALPGFVNRTISANGLPPQPFDSQIATIIERVKTCASITRQMVAAATDANGHFVHTKLGDPYKYCYNQWGGGWPVLPEVKTKNSEITRRLYMGIFPQGRWGDGRGFSLYLNFSSLPKNDNGGELSVSEIFDVFGVVRAEIEQSAPSATAQTDPVAQRPALPIQGQGLPPTTDIWKSGMKAYTKLPVPDPNPQAPANCALPANSEVVVLDRSSDRGWRVRMGDQGSMERIRLNSQKPVPCGFIFFTTSDNLRK